MSDAAAAIRKPRSFHFSAELRDRKLTIWVGAAAPENQEIWEAFQVLDRRDEHYAQVDKKKEGSLVPVQSESLAAVSITNTTQKCKNSAVSSKTATAFVLSEGNLIPSGGTTCSRDNQTASAENIPYCCIDVLLYREYDLKKKYDTSG